MAVTMACRGGRGGGGGEVFVEGVPWLETEASGCGSGGGGGGGGG